MARSRTNVETERIAASVVVSCEAVVASVDDKQHNVNEITYVTQSLSLNSGS